MSSVIAWIVQRLEDELRRRRRAARQRHRDAERQAELRVDHRTRPSLLLRAARTRSGSRRRRVPTSTRSTAAGSMRVARAQRQHGVDRALHVAAAGVRLDAGAHELEPLRRPRRAASASGAVRSRRAGSRSVPRGCVAGARKPARRERGGVQAGGRRPAGMESLRPRAVGEELHRARRLAAGDRRARGEAVGVEAEDAARPRRPRRTRRTCRWDGSRARSAPPAASAIARRAATS